MPTHTSRRPGRRFSLALPLAGALLAATAGSALAQSPSTSPVGAVDHPTGPLDVVLSMETGGGFVPFGYFITQAPTFVLYGDNSAIFRPSQPGDDGELPAFLKASLSPDQVDALLTYALSVGRLADAAGDYMEMRVTDAPTTVFTIDAGGVTKSVSVYALGIGPQSGPDAPMYAAFEDLANLLSTFEEQIEKGQVLTAEVYQPETYRVVLTEASLEQPDLVDWPWSGLTLDDFGPFPQNESFRLAGLTPDQMAEVTPVPSGGSFGMAIRSPDGESAFYLQWRPLLPGEPLEPAVLGGKGF